MLKINVQRELTKMLLDLVKLDREETRLTLTDTIAN